MNPIELQRRGEDASERLNAADGWYHSFSLPNGQTIEGSLSLDLLHARWAEFNLPDSLAGKRILDIGAWDGWFSFEAARRGADVTALDNWNNPKFHSIRKLLGLPVQYIVADLYAVPGLKLEPFDIVFFLGVLYHLRHPLLGLEIAASLTRDTAFIDSFVIDGQEEADGPAIPYMEFYETDELGNQLDNWFGPTLSCLHGLCRAAGFVCVRTLGIRDGHATLIAHRRWEPDKMPGSGARVPDLFRVVRAIDWSINFDSNQDQYLLCYFNCERRLLNRNELYFSIGPFAAQALKVVRERDYYVAAVRLPPALGAGWWDVRLKVADGPWSGSQRIAVDMPVRAGALEIKGIPEIARSGGAASIWIAGLAENADTANLRITLGEYPLTVKFIAAGGADDIRQVNTSLPESLSQGIYTLTVHHGQAVARLDDVRVI